ncbi:MAG TPA: SDR family oxidoreductase [Burkholderiaceae bacterium]|nr:SDR family oxidoreductase [Burkholderiaceae bacterium]
MADANGYTVITGATRGIGRAIAQRLLARGERVVGIARNPDPSFAAPVICADLADRQSTRRALDELVSRFDVHRLVNNAGFNRMQPLGSIRPEDSDRIFAINIDAAITCAQAVLPSMIAAASSGGAASCCRIVNIASRSLLGRIDGSVYSAAKAGLVGLTRSWALELATRGITVNCVAPGPIETEMFRANNPAQEPRTRALLSAVPMHRLGVPDEVAAAVDYFLSQAAAFTTGQTLFVCGGSSISQIHV